MKLPDESKGLRYDQAIQRLLVRLDRQVSTREVRNALKDGVLTINGRRVAPGARVTGDEELDLERFITRGEAVVAADPSIDARILFEDDELLVLSKPSGLPTAPLRPNEPGTLLSAAIHIAPEISTAGPALEGGLVHRLDRDTSGVVLFAKTADRRRTLREAFSAHLIRKRYLAITSRRLPETENPGGDPGEKPIEVVGAISNSDDRRRVRVWLDNSRGLPARTTFRTIEPLAGDRALVEAESSTGRRHQIRAHLATVGAPILGDVLYGGDWVGELPRVALHASEVLLPDGHEFKAELTEDLRSFVARSRTGG